MRVRVFMQQYEVFGSENNCNRKVSPPSLFPSSHYILRQGTGLHAVGSFAHYRHRHLVVPMGALFPHLEHLIDHQAQSSTRFQSLPRSPLEVRSSTPIETNRHCYMTVRPWYALATLRNHAEEARYHNLSNER